MISEAFFSWSSVGIRDKNSRGWRLFDPVIYCLCLTDAVMVGQTSIFIYHMAFVCIFSPSQHDYGNK